jgi:hypothetical protein
MSYPLTDKDKGVSVKYSSFLWFFPETHSQYDYYKDRGTECTYEEHRIQVKLFKEEQEKLVDKRSDYERFWLEHRKS